MRMLQIVVCIAAMLAVPAQGEELWLLAKYDRDGDQRITQAEVEQHKQSLFLRMDADADGRIDFGEYEAVDHARRKALLKSRFLKLDQDGDNKVSSQEYSTYLGLFESIDSNGDGAVTKSEMGMDMAEAYITRCLWLLCIKTKM